MDIFRKIYRSLTDKTDIFHGQVFDVMRIGINQENSRLFFSVLTICAEDRKSGEFLFFGRLGEEYIGRFVTLKIFSEGLFPKYVEQTIETTSGNRTIATDNFSADYLVDATCCRSKYCKAVELFVKNERERQGVL